MGVRGRFILGGARAERRGGGGVWVVVGSSGGGTWAESCGVEEV